MHQKIRITKLDPKTGAILSYVNCDDNTVHNEVWTIAPGKLQKGSLLGIDIIRVKSFIDITIGSEVRLQDDWLWYMDIPTAEKYGCA
jgi:hypothetical protein